MHINCLKIHIMIDWNNLPFFLEVARTQRVSLAAIKLGVEHTTVSRRIKQLEMSLNTLLFEKSRTTGFTLTKAGADLMSHIEKMESQLLTATEQIGNLGSSLSGHLRIAATEGFGSYIVTPIGMAFHERYPGITIDVMPFQRFVNQTKREADIAITIERPIKGPYIYRKISDYALRLYGTHEYFENKPLIKNINDLREHAFISYVDELIISEQLRFFEEIIPSEKIIFCSNSIVAQLRACLQGKALAVLPCFMAETHPLLQSVLPNQLTAKRQFWMYYHEDLKSLKRIEIFSSFFKHIIQKNEKLMLGQHQQFIL